MLGWTIFFLEDPDCWEPKDMVTSIFLIMESYPMAEGELRKRMANMFKK